MKKILVVGATGNLGPYLIKEFAQKGHQVSALIRPRTMTNAAKIDPLKALNIRLVEGDLSNSSSLKEACKGQDVVVSAVGGEQIMMQSALAKAAAEAGVERFVPSEFGIDPHAAGTGSCDLFDAKAAAQNEIKAAGVPTTMIYSNGFMEFWGTGLGQLGPTNPPDEVQLYGKGQIPAYMCTLGDIARFTEAIISDPKTLHREVAISTNPITQEDMIHLWESMSGKSVTRQLVSPDELDQIIHSSTKPEDMMTRIFTQLHRSVWIRGDCNKIRSEVMQANDLYRQIRVTGHNDYYAYFL